MSEKKIHIGSRGSRLAVIQVQELKRLIDQTLDGVTVTEEVFQSAGDIDKKTSLIANTKDDLWTDVLDQAVLDKRIDVAVHSAKDLPEELHPELAVFALTRSPDETDAFVGRMSLGQLPAGSKVGTSSALRRTALAKMRPDCEMVAVRGTIEERLAKIDSGELDGLIVATVALKRLGMEDRIAGIMPWEGFPLQGQLAVVGRRDNTALRELFSPLDVRREYGTVTLVGAGPGDPDLITLKGVKALRSAECVMYDYLVHKGILEHAPQAEKIYVGKRKGDHTLVQQELCQLIRQQAIKGRDIVRLKGGDPLIFGRGADEIAYLKKYHIRVEVVPGVSSATGIPSMLGLPLTARDYASSVAFLTAHQANEIGTKQEIAVPEGVDTLVFLMGLSKLPEIIAAVRAAGRDAKTPVAIISRGTRCDQKVVTGTLETIVEDVRREGPQPPALIVIGKTVSLYQDREPPRTIVYTGTHPEKYQSLGRVIHLPMIRIAPAPVDDAQLARLADELPAYDMIVLTSRFAVRHFTELARRLASLETVLQEKDIVVIGRDTAQALMDAGYHPRHVAQTETARGLFDLLVRQYDLNGKRILFPRSNLPNPFLKRALEEKGASVTELTIYINTTTEREDLPGDKVDAIIFTSPSTVHNFLEKYQSIPPQWAILSKGPVTQQALRDNQYESEIMNYG